MRYAQIIACMLGGGVAVAGCFFDNVHNCDLNMSLACFYGAGGGTGGTGGSGGTGGTGGTPDKCVPHLATGPVDDSCGMFVSSSKGDDTKGDGTKEKPFATIAKAHNSPKKGPIYLCAESFSEAVRVSSGATIYGGLDCANAWTYAATKKSEVAPDAGLVPLVVELGVGLDVEDVAFRAPDAADAGGSSIAIIAAKDADVSLTRCDVEAGAGKDGAAGEAFMMDAPAGAMGGAGMDACAADVVIGGKSVTNACDAADPNDDSISGAGGIGQDSSGGDGSNGQPDGAMNGGAGEGAMACTNGGPGDVGVAGMSGVGAQGMGMISAQGYAGTPGTSGESGKPGQGGGGGGGAKGGSGVNKCAMAASAGGASGGSGGSGGCGGKGGNGGQAGGSSIGIVSLEAKLTLESVTITVKAGGRGGSGGIGQNGGMGGPGGVGGKKGGASLLKDGCSGGPGGAGGLGGMGGGGLGGHSIGIAHSGEAPDTKGATIMIGAAGNGGAGDGADGNGAAGVAAKEQSF